MAATASTLLEAEQEGRYGLTIPLYVDHVDRMPDHDSLAQHVHMTDVTGTHVKATVFDDNELADYEFAPGTWYEFDDVNPDVFRGTIGLTARWTRQVRQLDEPPASAETDPISAVRQLGDLQRLAALDIETVATVDEQELEIGNPDHGELLCVGLGYYDRETEQTESVVLFREDGSTAAEQALIEDVLAWLDARDIDGLLTFNGTGYDLPMLVGRAENLGAERGDSTSPDHVRSTLESYQHADLMVLKNRVLGEGGLEDMAAQVGAVPPKTLLSDFDIDVSPREWRTDQWETMRDEGREPPSDDVEDPTVYNSDVPYLGQQWLDALAAGEDATAMTLYDCLDHYTAADIGPLFAIADSEHAAGQPVFQSTYSA